MFSLNDLSKATDILHSVIQPTAQHNWPLLCKNTGCDVWVKHENHTPTTAFKVRGGIYLLHQMMQQSSRPEGLISATRGNHGQSLSFSASRAGLPVTIVVPECNSEDQNKAIKGFGAQLVIHGKDFEAARAHSLVLQKKYGFDAVAPFEKNLVLGVATYAFEFFSAVKDLDTVYVPVGMGSGICALIKTRDLLGLKTKIVGVVSEGAPTFYLSFNAGKVIATDDANTIADGVATSSPIEEAFEMIKQGADRIITVSDQEIAAAMYQYFCDTHNLAEGAGAVPLAGLNKEKEQMKGKKVGLILTGGNIDFARFVQHVADVV
ncbi:threonine dehydratase [Pseudoalteromonas denitrificans]|uniref:Threonine dehydratase n=1 Tax=Pseudoalteromonas denitrificans DSM 6059 TaxID=1123010 RepID=A0A1I1R667_9GAMM|nr:threonine dehydratase [Pseudoalteromonas denitrificans]SFD27648.1 threonine dehydratase [Pseudoalteromonas denitrificans DSM 6059]